MADTSVQHEVEDWVRRTWMRQQFGELFYRDRCKLDPGGEFEFDAVSQDGKTIACISTSSARTAAGKHGVGKLQKIRADMLFLLLAKDVSRRFMVFTESDMYDLCVSEKAERKRVPACIEFFHAEIPDEMKQRLCDGRARASREASPSALSLFY